MNASSNGDMMMMMMNHHYNNKPLSDESSDEFGQHEGAFFGEEFGGESVDFGAEEFGEFKKRPLFRLSPLAGENKNKNSVDVTTSTFAMTSTSSFDGSMNLHFSTTNEEDNLFGDVSAFKQPEKKDSVASKRPGPDKPLVSRGLSFCSDDIDEEEEDDDDEEMYQPRRLQRKLTREASPGVDSGDSRMLERRLSQVNDGLPAQETQQEDEYSDAGFDDAFFPTNNSNMPRVSTNSDHDFGDDSILHFPADDASWLFSHPHNNNNIDNDTSNNSMTDWGSVMDYTKDPLVVSSDFQTSQQLPFDIPPAVDSSQSDADKQAEAFSMFTPMYPEKEKMQAVAKTPATDSTTCNSNEDCIKKKNNDAKARARKGALRTQRPGAYGVSETSHPVLRRDSNSNNNDDPKGSSNKKKGNDNDNSEKNEKLRRRHLQGELRPGAFDVKEGATKTKTSAKRNSSSEDNASVMSKSTISEKLRVRRLVGVDVRPGAYGVSEKTYSIAGAASRSNNKRCDDDGSLQCIEAAQLDVALMQRLSSVRDGSVSSISTPPLVNTTVSYSPQHYLSEDSCTDNTFKITSYPDDEKDIEQGSCYVVGRDDNPTEEQKPMVPTDEACITATVDTTKQGFWSRHKWKIIGIASIVVGIIGTAIGVFSGGGKSTASSGTVSQEIQSIQGWEHLVQVCQTHGEIKESLLPEGIVIRAQDILSKLQELKAEEGDSGSVTRKNKKENDNENTSLLLDCSTPNVAALAMALALPSSSSVVSRDRYILTAFFLEADGIAWDRRDGWLTDIPPCDGWYGVKCLTDSNVTTSLKVKKLPPGGKMASELFELTSLTRLVLRGEMGGSIPSSVSMLTRLRTLDLRSKQFTGTIPAELSDLSVLTSLHLAGGATLSGSIPPSLGMTQLTDLTILAENLESTIPIELMRANLTHLSLGGKFQGPFPSEFWSHPTLLHLDLFETQLLGSVVLSESKTNWRSIIIGRENNFEGTLPTEIGLLTDLDVFVTRNNDITGSLPTEIGNLSNLTILDIAGNLMTGTFPTEIGNMSSMERCAVASNFFVGTIPTELAQISGLKAFWAYDKHECEGANGLSMDETEGLSGTVPLAVCSLENLTEFVLSCRSPLYESCPSSCCSCF